ncbi:flagellar protein FlaG [Neobacillus sp. NPDC058068]|uniref:flagellar protein FlaG n=1 Tax=Neobacillus sp. NPDC058068 TaxID=3346325 RepID=UPI0036D96219
MEITQGSTNIQNKALHTIKNNNENILVINNGNKKFEEEPYKKITSPKEVNQVEIKNALNDFNKVFKPSHLEFRLHEASGKYFVNIIDDGTQEVLKQIPSEDFLEMVAAAKEQQGIIIDKRV